MTKKLLKIQYLSNLGLKISKSPSLNPTHLGHSNNAKSATKFPYNFQFWFNWIFTEKMFNIQ